MALKWETAVDSAFLYGEPSALYQVVTNLIRNAVDASRGRERVEVTLDQAGDTLRLTVRDRGVGIAPEHLDRIFEAGFTTKPPGSGSGMGLAVGAGSAFTLELPIPRQRGGESQDVPGGG